ncbi:MAG: hypothetical protein HOH18_04660 [Kordiimonadaceae bacterium]|nr:hypothetical protein [Kordiimonadaceae bacterium]MBT6035746.1 hypothetical protein [Kordiimonadaceae bacterium]MBT7582519.1 hypothetical protein [Kordiimonadaceae bacterium]
MESYAQEMRDITPNSIRPPANQKLRIPDQFFRHDQVRDKVRDKDILSLSVIRKEVQKNYPGRIVDVRFLIPKREGINYLYDVRLLTKAGKLLSIKVDAKSAQIVDVKG